MKTNSNDNQAAVRETQLMVLRNGEVIVETIDHHLDGDVHRVSFSGPRAAIHAEEYRYALENPIPQHVWRVKFIMNVADRIIERETRSVILANTGREAIDTLQRMGLEFAYPAYVGPIANLGFYGGLSG